MVANVLDRFEFRSVRANEAEEIAEIEKICFPPHEHVLKKICLKGWNMHRNFFLLQ